MAKTCPGCGLLSPDSAVHCPCGIDFLATIPEVENQRARNRWLVGAAAGAMVVFAGVALGLITALIAGRPVLVVIPLLLVILGGRIVLRSLACWMRVRAWQPPGPAARVVRERSLSGWAAFLRRGGR